MALKHLLAILVATIATSGAAAHSSSYNFTYKGYAFALEPVAIGVCIPYDINDAGNVVGLNYRKLFENIDSLGFVTGANGVGSTPLSLGGKDATAYAINASGQVVGLSEIDGSDVLFYSFITDPGGTNIRRVGPPGAAATAINDLGQVAGDLSGVAFLTAPNGEGYRFIESPGLVTGVSAMNSSAQLTGVFSSAGVSHAYVTGPNGEGMIDLNLPSAAFSAGVDINDLGQVTGEQWTGEAGHREQYVTGPNGSDVRLLGTLGKLPGGLSEGGGINNRGILVGISSRGDKYGRIYVTVTGPDGVMRNLNKYVENLPNGVYLTGNPVINNRNQIAARATDGRCYLVCPNRNCQRPAP